jgi:signal transduction histidine kinase
MKKIEKFFPDLKSFEEKEGFVRWFIYLRYIAFFTTTVILIVSYFVFQILSEKQFLYLLLISAGVGISNFIFSKVVGRISHSKHLVMQMLCDILLITLLLYFSGWAENPFFVIYVFHAIISGMIFDKKTSLFISAIIWAISSFVSFMIYFGIIPYFELFGTKIFTKLEFVLGFVSAIGVLLFVSSYFTSFLTQVLKEKIKTEKELYLEVLRYSRLATVGEISAQIIHNISTPLTVVFGKISLLYEKLKKIQNSQAKSEDIEKIKKDIESVKEETEKIINNTRKFSDIARYEERKEEKFNINDIVEKILKLTSFIAEKENVKVLKETSDVPKVKGNPDEIEQVIMNLITNAIDAMHNSKEKILRIRTYKKDDFVVCEVQDTGSGIPENLKDKIFTPFFTTKKSGTGIGLSSSKRIVKKYGGEILFESEEGKGTRFFVMLPAQKEEN